MDRAEKQGADLEIPVDGGAEAPKLTRGVESRTIPLNAAEPSRRGVHCVLDGASVKAPVRLTDNANFDHGAHRREAP